MIMHLFVELEYTVIFAIEEQFINMKTKKIISKPKSLS